MKQSIIIIIAAILGILVSCKQDKPKVQIIPNYDLEYYTGYQVNKYPVFKDSTYESKLHEDLRNMIRELNPSAKDKSIMFPINYELFITKSGEIEKIRNATNLNDYTNQKAIFEAFKELEQIDVKFAELVAKWSFIPAMKDGKQVKYKADFLVSAIRNKDGNISVKIANMPFQALPQVYFMAVEEMPDPIGGIKDIQKKIKYPEIARRAGIEGRVFIKAYIDENGDVFKTTLIKGIGGGCDEAASLAVKQTKFKPGRQKGKPVKVQISIPILFKIR